MTKMKRSSNDNNEKDRTEEVGDKRDIDTESQRQRQRKQNVLSNAVKSNKQMNPLNFGGRSKRWEVCACVVFVCLVQLYPANAAVYAAHFLFSSPYFFSRLCLCCFGFSTFVFEHLFDQFIVQLH